jgi:hypothetical protein
MFGMQMQSTTETTSPIDDFLESYVSWREACYEVDRVYGLWSRGPVDERAANFEIYRAALNREEQAALVHHHWAERLGAPVR